MLCSRVTITHHMVGIRAISEAQGDCSSAQSSAAYKIGEIGKEPRRVACWARDGVEGRCTKRATCMGRRSCLSVPGLWSAPRLPPARPSLSYPAPSIAGPSCGMEVLATPSEMITRGWYDR